MVRDAAVSRSRVVGPDGSPCSPACATNSAHLFSSSSFRFDLAVIAARVDPRRQACATARTAATRAPAVCRTRTDSQAVAPVVTTSSMSSTSPPHGPADLDPARDVALPLARREPDRVPGEGPHPQRRDDRDARDRRGSRQRGRPGHRHADAPPTSWWARAPRSAGRRPRPTPAVGAVRSPTRRASGRDEVGAAVFLHRDDRRAARPRRSGRARRRAHRDPGVG